MRLIVPAPPGGAGDIVGRLVASELGAALDHRYDEQKLRFRELKAAMAREAATQKKQ